MSADIVFDLGAVLLRWEPRLLLQQVFADRTPDAASIDQWMTDIFRGFAPESEWSQFDRGTLDPAQVAQRIASRSGFSIGELERFIAAIPDHLQPLPATVQLIGQLKQRGHRLYYLSNMPAVFARHLQRSHDFAGWFGDGIFSADVRMVKPESAIFQLASQRWQLQDPVFIDDSQKNVDAALALGWRAIRFDDAGQVSQALQQLGLLPAQ